MSAKRKGGGGSRGKINVLAAFPLSASEVMLVASGALDASMARASAFRFSSGLKIRDATIDKRAAERVVLRVEPMGGPELIEDQIVVRDLRGVTAGSSGRQTSPTFLHGPLTPVELKVPHLAPRFPFASTLVDRHVSVMCCTGCNGGVHDRDLVVVNSHVGGGWTGVWVQTA